MEKNEQVYTYFLNELKVNPKVADILYSKITKYEDIYMEFLEWLKIRNFESLKLLEIEGYTSKQIHESFPHFTGIGVFNVLVDLRDNRDRTIENIKNGFPRK